MKKKEFNKITLILLGIFILIQLISAIFNNILLRGIFILLFIIFACIQTGVMIGEFLE